MGVVVRGGHGVGLGVGVEGGGRDGGVGLRGVGLWGFRREWGGDG